VFKLKPDLKNSLLQSLFDETEQRPMTVSELSAEVRRSVERSFATVWVEGEIVNFLAASSGHWYFSLNDGTAQIKCVCWKGTNYRVRFKPRNGITVRIRGRLTFWESKGEVKLNVETLDPSGEGALAAAYEQIKAKLEREGLFAQELKRQIPFFPRRVAVITSRTGAAYHDIHNVLTRRAKSVNILLIPATVQGEGAADSIRRAVIDVNLYNRTLAPRYRIDVVILGRGGGSAEDLWAFNDELLARHIRSSEIPVISAVGHEIDWTISDLVADLRAATPSAAAEMVAQREDDIEGAFEAREGQLSSLMEYKLLIADTRFNDALNGLETQFADTVQRAQDRFSEVNARLTPAALTAMTAALGNLLEMLIHRGNSAMERSMKLRSEAVNLHMATLHALSPLGVLTRGYSITQMQDGRVLRDAATAMRGDKLKIRLEHGKLNAEVLSSE